MDFTKLNPWNWFKKEDDRESDLPVRQNQGSAQPMMRHGHMADLHADLDKLFDNFFQSFGFPSYKSPFSGLAANDFFKPRVDISGSESEYNISAELPGVDEKDIQVELKDNSLIIRAEKHQEDKSEGKGYYRVERNYGSFQRVLAVPEDSDVDGIKATCKNGVVTISIPRKAIPQSSAKKIPIE